MKIKHVTLVVVVVVVVIVNIDVSMHQASFSRLTSLMSIRGSKSLF